MSTINIPKQIRRALSTGQYFRNGKAPDATACLSLNEQTNQIAAYRVKELASFSSPLKDCPTGINWRWAAHTGPYAQYLYVHTIMTRAGVATNPYSLLTVWDMDDTVIGTSRQHYGTMVPLTAGVVPADFGYGNSYLLDGANAIAVDADTAIHGQFTCVNGGKLISASVFEISFGPDTGNGYADQGITTQGPIYDSHRSSSVSVLRDMWLYGGSHLFNWSIQDTPRQNATTTSLNVVDDTSTAVSAASPGYTLDLTYRSTVRRAADGVPCIMKVRAKMSAGSGLVKLRDSTGAALATVTVNSSTEQWWPVRFNLPTTLAKYDLTYESDGAGTLNLYAASVYQYEPDCYTVDEITGYGIPRTGEEWACVNPLLAAPTHRWNTGFTTTVYDSISGAHIGEYDETIPPGTTSLMNFNRETGTSLTGIGLPDDLTERPMMGFKAGLGTILNTNNPDGAVLVFALIRANYTGNGVSPDQTRIILEFGGSDLQLVMTISGVMRLQSAAGNLTTSDALNNKEAAAGTRVLPYLFQGYEIDATNSYASLDTFDESLSVTGAGQFPSGSSVFKMIMTELTTDNPSLVDFTFVDVWMWRGVTLTADERVALMRALGYR